MRTVLKINRVSKKFKEYEALKNLNFEIKQGEIFGFLGPSGSGKTTTIKIVTGQLRQTSGTAELLGRDSRQLNHEIYKEVGIVSDNSGLYEKISVYENIMLYAKLLDVDTQHVESLLMRVGLYEHRKQKAGKLSKGQKQRLVLIRSLIHNPKILFLDEPTSGLDPTTTFEVHKLLLELKESGMSIFLTTHNMEEATKLCDRVALLNDGQIVEYGTPEELSMKYYPERGYSVVLDDHSSITLKDDEKTADKLSEWVKSRRVISIHSTEPNLEEVFLAVTGRELA